MDPNKIYEKQISENLRLYSAAKQLICAIEAGAPFPLEPSAASQMWQSHPTKDPEMEV